MEQKYKGYYVTPCGRVWSYKYKKFLKPKLTKFGYLEVVLVLDGRKYGKKVHRLVAECWLENPKNLPQVNHLDENKENNCVSNLQWCTAKENMRYSNAKPFRCVETGEVFECLSDVNRKYFQHISKVLNCKYKTAYGYHWEYVNNEI